MADHAPGMKHGDGMNCPTCHAPGRLHKIDNPTNTIDFEDGIWFNEKCGGWECYDCWLK